MRQMGLRPFEMWARHSSVNWEQHYQWSRALMREFFSQVSFSFVAVCFLVATVALQCPYSRCVDVFRYE